MRATAVVVLLFHALPGAHGAANATSATFVRGPEGLNYPEAEAFCTEIGATIATIHSAAENEIARIACGASMCWLGLEEIGGNARTPKASQTWRWVDPAYTNWATSEPINAGGVDLRNAIIDTAGEWRASGDGSRSPLCRVAGELNFTLDHTPHACFVNTECSEGDIDTASDPTCCGRGAETSNIKHRSCQPDQNHKFEILATYQFVQTGEACDVGESVEEYKKYKCYPCKPGKTCDMGPGDKEGCWWPCGGGCIAVIIIFFVILPLCCICCSVAACCFAVQQNNRQPAARIQQQPVAYAAARPAGGAYAPGQPAYGGAVQMQQYGKQPYAAQPTVVQPTVVQPMVVQPTVVQPTVVQPTVVQGAVVQGTVVQGEIQREY